MERQVETARYRDLCKTHALMRDPLVVVRVSDLEKLLDAYEGNKPRVRVPAKVAT